MQGVLLTDTITFASGLLFSGARLLDKLFMVLHDVTGFDNMMNAMINHRSALADSLKRQAGGSRFSFCKQSQ